MYVVVLLDEESSATCGERRKAGVFECEGEFMEGMMMTSSRITIIVINNK